MTDKTEWVKPEKIASSFVWEKIQKLETMWNKENKESAVRAILAKLRHGIGKDPGSQPELYDITLPEGLQGEDDEPTYGEWAAHTALTLYAMHQQGTDLSERNMHKGKQGLGTAVQSLIDEDNSNEEAVRRRFNAAATSGTFEELTWHLRGLIQLMKAKDIPLDYSELTEDLYRFQFPERRDSIRLKWGREFYRMKKNQKEGTEAQ